MLISDQRIPEKPSLEIGADVLQRRPDLAMGLSLSIALWANIEARLDSIFLLCTRDESGLASFQMKRGWDARAKFLHRTIRDTQGEDAGKEIRAILRAVAGPAKKRHEVAHGIWGICAELPHDLILIDNSDFLDMARQAIRAESANVTEMRFDPTLMHETARVVSISHLECLYRELSEAVSIIHAFMIEKMPRVVHVFGRDKILPAKCHPLVASRLFDTQA
ncbi:MAG: hypothetical protein WA978_04095 [Sphingopyxis granuli]|uniref:hypothetical protein n=1 Tax=Sphingopyxis granuli TaxID=267128 RepID=UPI003C70F58D